MASPQTNNGFTTIANEIMEVAQHFQFTMNEYKVILCVWRFTYGFKRKEHKMSISFFEKHTGLQRTRINETLKSLEKDKVLLIQKDGKRTSVISFNKDYDTWEKERYSRFASVQYDTSVQDSTSIQNDTTETDNSSVQDGTSIQDGTSVQDGTSTSVQDGTSFGQTVVYKTAPKKESLNKTLKKDKKENFASMGEAVNLYQSEYDELVLKYGEELVGETIDKIADWGYYNPNKWSAQYKNNAALKVADWIERDKGNTPKQGFKKNEPVRTYARYELTPQDLADAEREKEKDDNEFTKFFND